MNAAYGRRSFQDSHFASPWTNYRIETFVRLPSNEEALEAVRGFSQKTRGGFLVLCGTASGVGKTHLAGAVGGARRQAGQSVDVVLGIDGLEELGRCRADLVI